MASLDAGRLAQRGDVVEGEEVCVVGQPAHTENHHQHDEHLHDLKISKGDPLFSSRLEVARFPKTGIVNRGYVLHTGIWHELGGSHGSSEAQLG